MGIKGMEFIKEITSYIFVEDKPEKADIIFVPGGSWPEPAENAAKIWLDGHAPYILPSGKYSMSKGYFPGTMTKKDKYRGNFKTEWEFMKDVIMSYGVNETAILKEDDAVWTRENAFKSREVTDKHNLVIKKAIICCKSFHAKRCLMFYSLAYPEAEFIVCPVDIEDITKDNWFKTESGIEHVMGELSRCGGQLKKAIPIWLENC
ncbi:YdcF family protein [Clostridium chromiireducens]|uniref:YdcF family protein n=1 Tax=Clostridium chromiireducens TaxID=225345 RepID=A0A399IN42_9CLOT|nr:YdcF family protein [Clostridium chromiireducens]RII33987.1 YdcF family protein [Clostridium chromiireducens]